MTDIPIRKPDDKRVLLDALRATEIPYTVRITKGVKRSVQQNRYLWGVVYPVFLRDSGLGEQGWRSEDLHQYFLGECFGWETLEGFGRKRARPLRTTTSPDIMNKQEFADYVAFIQEKAAGYGVVIPDPDEGVE